MSWLSSWNNTVASSWNHQASYWIDSAPTRFILVFIDDILIYNMTWSEHLRQVQLVFDKLHEHQLFLKRSKYFFSEWTMAYLGHVISTEGVTMDTKKCELY
jgi:hypothetical protein